MSLSAKIREQLISSFRAELKEHVQTMTDGLLGLEQNTVSGKARQTTLEDVFRAAHSLKGAARAVGVTAIEQLAHALEDLLDDMKQDTIALNPELFNACYQGLDAIQAVQVAYESGETTPPLQALQALTTLQGFRVPADSNPTEPYGKASTKETPASDAPDPASAKPKMLTTTLEQRLAEDWQGLDESKIPLAPSQPTQQAPAQPAQETATPAQTTTQNDRAEHATEKPEASSPPAVEVAPRQALNDETIRVSVSKLDALLAQLSELLVTKIRAEQWLVQVRQAQEFMATWQKEWLAVRSAYSRLARKNQDISQALGWTPSRWPEVKPQSFTGENGNNGTAALAKDLSQVLQYAGDSQERLHEMHALVNNLARRYADDTMHMSLVIDDLEQEIKRTRMLPLTTITGTFGRMVRDLAYEADKQARLQIIGGATELDKRVLEQIKDPLIHLLRNAIDHGIEPPDKREAIGKPASGTITLKAEQLGQDVIISVCDDGAGLDLEAVRQAVARQGGVDPQLLNKEDLKEGIFNVGVSTSTIITDISGRGVGLDVVRRNVEALHGRIDVDWAPDAGTTFTLTLPLTLTSSHGLLVRVSNELFAIPLNAVERIENISPEQISPLEGHDTIRYNDRPITLVRLNDVLGLPPVEHPAEDPRLPVVILAAAERRMAFAVDELAGEQEVVIKGLGKQLSRVGGIAGATVMGSGEVVLILNVADLIKLAMRGQRRSVFEQIKTTSTTRTRDGQRILVVDDSITTRTLQKNILQAAGYQVKLATDGQEALNTITSEGIPDLIVSDIAMPHMNGFELTEQIKNDAQTANVPVILVTSLDSPKDKAKGIQAGADAYIIKSSFDQNNLLETIEQLI